MKKPKDLSLSEAIEWMRSELERLTDLPPEFQGLDPDRMFIEGYRVALADLEACTRKNTKD